ncbi:MAG: Na/Pi symporter [Planctomycetes bacterium]|nr:Na/Pi symporter [Planctomycetota bacterium]
MVVLIYFFLCAINMMGKGIKITAANHDYQGKFSDDSAFSLYVKKPGQTPQVTVDPVSLSEQPEVGRKVGAIGDVTAVMGAVAVGDKVVRAVCPTGTVVHGKCARIVEVRPEFLVVEPVLEYKSWLYAIFEFAKNPFMALMVGILITAIFQSSSFTTSFTVGMVATVPAFGIELAIPIIMGANIGTSVTNIMVSLGYIRRRDEFRRAFAGATVHDFFNVLTVAVLFTLELTTGVLHLMAGKLASLVYHGGATAVSEEPTNYIKIAVTPVIKFIQWLLAGVFGFGQNATGIVMTILAIVILFVALLLLVKVLRTLVLKRAESFFDRVLFRNAPTAFVVGLILTASVQSSSVTTSLVVPLIAAGLLTLNQVFPYLLGANIGTTVTALIASFATSATSEEGAKVGLTLACVHLLFNVLGAIIFYPLRWIPIGMANALAAKAAESKRYAIFFVLGVFFGLPLLGIAVHELYVRFAGG